MSHKLAMYCLISLKLHRLLIMMIMMIYTCPMWHSGIAPPSGQRKNGIFTHFSYTPPRWFIGLISRYFYLLQGIEMAMGIYVSPRKQECIMNSPCFAWYCSYIFHRLLIMRLLLSSLFLNMMGVVCVIIEKTWSLMSWGKCWNNSWQYEFHKSNSLMKNAVEWLHKGSILFECWY